ncbi:MAG: hypothetical protein Q7R96_01905 [Nanoarchaeota archaeon]|nr:hypothetical protein [Nanoarchaeota archaeon]
MSLLLARRPAVPRSLEADVECFAPIPAVLKHPKVLANRSGRKKAKLEMNKLRLEYRPTLQRVLQVREAQEGWFRSGRRSILHQNGKMYRLKGVRFDDLWSRSHNAMYVNGAQFLLNSQYEFKYARRFNDVLVREGFPLAMVPVARYRPDVQVNRRYLAVSVFEVPGDTRLDEFRYIRANIAQGQVDDEFKMRGVEIDRQLGFAVGSLLRTLYHAGLSWSDNIVRTNAHAGNIILFPLDEQRLGVGLVDFDACAERKELSESGLRDLQKKESQELSYDLGKSYLHSEVDLRLGFSQWDNTAIKDGFWSGYRSRKPVAWIDSPLFDTYMGMLRSVAEKNARMLVDNTFSW